MHENEPFPAGWIRSSVKDIIDPSRAITYGIVQPGPRYSPDQGVPIIRGQDYSSGCVRDDDLYHVSPRLAASFARASVCGGDLLLSIVGYVGSVAEVPENLAGANLTQTTARLSLRAHLKSRYFLHFMRTRYFRAEVKRFTKGSAQPGLNLADVEKMRVAFPPDPNERLAIVRVLDALDTAIRQTEAIIAKLRQVKRGMLHDLLTRGIDANGELRPQQSQFPHLYKQSRLGWIPKEWDCSHLVEKIGVFGGKRLPAGHSYAHGQTHFKYLRVTDFYQRGYQVENLENLQERTFNALERYEIKPGDLFISIAGSLGHVGVYASPEHSRIRTILTENAARLSPSRSVSQQYVAAYMNSMMVQEQIEAEKGTGGGVPKLALFRIEQLWIAWPTLDEQYEIARRVEAIGCRLEAENDELKKSKTLKAGLMDDLLTGRVRVTPLLEAASTP